MYHPRQYDELYPSPAKKTMLFLLRTAWLMLATLDSFSEKQYTLVSRFYICKASMRFVE
jgi:hypothetical protein